MIFFILLCMLRSIDLNERTNERMKIYFHFMLTIIKNSTRRNNKQKYFLLIYLFIYLFFVNFTVFIRGCSVSPNLSFSLSLSQTIISFVRSIYNNNQQNKTKKFFVSNKQLFDCLNERSKIVLFSVVVILSFHSNIIQSSRFVVIFQFNNRYVVWFGLVRVQYNDSLDSFRNIYIYISINYLISLIINIVFIFCLFLFLL